MRGSNKENIAIFILCAVAGLLWAQSAGLFKPAGGNSSRRLPGKFDIPASEDQSRREAVASGFERPEEPAAGGPVRSSLSTKELRIVDKNSNVVMRIGVSHSGSGIWMGRPGSAAEFEAGVQANGLPFFQLYAEGRPGVVWSGVETGSMPTLLLRRGDVAQLGLGLNPSGQGEAPFLFHTDPAGKKQQFLNPS